MGGKDKIKILHLIKSLGRGGAETLLPETLAFHDRNTFDFSYAYFLPFKNQLVPSLEKLGAPVHCFGVNTSLGMLMRAYLVAKHIRAVNADLIHCHLPWAGIVGRLAGKIAKVPVIYTEHNKQERYHPLTRIANVKTLSWNKRVIAVSNDVRDSVYSHAGAGLAVDVVLNGVNTSKFDASAFGRPEAASVLGIPLPELLIGTVAVFRSQKRLDLWLELAAKVSRVFPHARFVIVGDGPLDAQVKSKATELNMMDKIYFPGRLEDVRNWLSLIDIYLMTSSFEGLPVALLEAMSMSRAVVSTDAGGVKEVIRGGVDGFIRPVDEWENLADDVITLIEDRALRDRLAANARMRVQENFSIEQMVKKLEIIYRETNGHPTSYR